MASNVNNGGNTPANKGSENAFVRVMKTIFVDDIVVKLITLASTVALWMIGVGLGVASFRTATSAAEFFTGFGANIADQFSSVGRGFASVIDMALLFAILYLVVCLLRRSGALPFLRFLAIALVALLILSSRLISFPIMGALFGYGVLLIVLIVLVMFPQELRRMMWKLASRSGNESKFNVEYDSSEEELRGAVGEIVKAVLNMSKDNIGALIVITPQTVPGHILESGTRLGAKLSQPLIECLFNTHADLHDGAVFIHGDKILAAGCFLPLSQNQSLPKELGTRHRAALGISEQYDVLTIVVSEETGIISIARDGKLDRYYDASMLTDVIEQAYGLKANNTRGKKRRIRKQ